MKKITALIFLLLFSKTVFAQGISVSTLIEDGVVPAGSIISFKEGVYKLSDQEYDSALFGVVTENPTISLQNLEDTASQLVLSNGEALVRVSNKNGNIEVGDFITSSTDLGVGFKAVRSGNILGVALEPFTASEGSDAEGLILVNVDIRNAYINTNLRTNLVSSLRNGLEAPFLTPLNSLRYLVASIVAVGSFILGFSSFGRTSGSGIEALGRNPLAKRAIQVSILFNFFLTTIIMFAGLILAYIILVL